MSRVFHFHASVRKACCDPKQALSLPLSPPRRRGVRHRRYASVLTLVVCVLLIGLARTGGRHSMSRRKLLRRGTRRPAGHLGGGSVSYYTDQGDLSPPAVVSRRDG